MARFERDTVLYFPHDSRAGSGDTLTILQSQYGNNGYAVWFKLLEKLAATEGHCIDCNSPMKWRLLIAYLGSNDITTVEIINLLVEMGALDKELWDAKLIWCQKLVDNIADVYKNRRREKPKKPITSCSNPITTGNNEITTESNSLNKSKVYKKEIVSKDTTKKESTEDIEKVFSFWNSQKVIVHRSLTDEIRKSIGTKLRDYSADDLCKAIGNYSEIVLSPEYYWKHKWTLKDFLARGIEKFLDGEAARQNYRTKPQVEKPNGSYRGSIPKVYKDPWEYEGFEHLKPKEEQTV